MEDEDQNEDENEYEDEDEDEDDLLKCITDYIFLNDYFCFKLHFTKFKTVSTHKKDFTEFFQDIMNNIYLSEVNILLHM